MSEKPKCPHCSLTDVSFERTCHNSACPSYAHAETVYEGWKDPPPATDAGEMLLLLAKTIHDECEGVTGPGDDSEGGTYMRAARCILALLPAKSYRAEEAAERVVDAAIRALGGE